MKLVKLSFRKKSVTVLIVLFLLLASFTIVLWSHHAVQEHIDAITGVGAAILIIPVEQFIEVVVLYRRFKKIEGKYRAYGYKENEDTKALAYNELAEKSTGSATLKYEGGNEFSIQLDNNDNHHKWAGRVEFRAINMASIAWWYVDPPSLGDSTGYKKAVIREDLKPLKIYMFSDDNQRFGREVLIKQ